LIFRSATATALLILPVSRIHFTPAPRLAWPGLHWMPSKINSSSATRSPLR